MREGKEEEKIASPMFPRLHVNDTDKGGPRAPPRNKMALYEQLSIPSQRFNPSTLPLPPQNARNLDPSSSQGNSHEGTTLSPFYVSRSAPHYSAEKSSLRSSDGENMRFAKMEFEGRPTRHVNFKSSNAVGSVAECSSLQRGSSNANNSSRKKVEDDDDFRVPTFINSENASSNKDITATEVRRLTTLQAKSSKNVCPTTCNASVQPASSCDNPVKETGTSDAVAGNHERCNELKHNVRVVAEVQRDKSSLHLEAAEKIAEPLRSATFSFDGKQAGNGDVCQEACGRGAPDGPLFQRSRASPNHRSADAAEIRNQISDDKDRRLLELSDEDRKDEMSDTSMVNSISGLEISPDDVVGVIGSKQFWKARRAIVNQQRIFAVQVFELHRLIKVQKLLAASPHLLVEENSCITAQKAPPKNLPLESSAKSQPLVKQKDGSEHPNQNADRQTESTGVTPIPAHTDSVDKTCHQPPRSAESPAPLPCDNRSSPWSFQPPPHRWLVPVMSPSEGLIYKPYTGPCPPAAGFVAPVYGNYSPYTIPPYQQQSAPTMTPTYLPTPFDLSAMNPMISNSTGDQMSPMTGLRPNLQTEQNSRGSCNMSLRSDAFTVRHRKVHASRVSELQGSTASRPSEKGQEGRDVLHLFPMCPAAEASAQPSESTGREHQTRVIRVVPHNARSATASAARIFRSIQEERQQLDHLSTQSSVNNCIGSFIQS